MLKIIGAHLVLPNDGVVHLLPIAIRQKVHPIPTVSATVCVVRVGVVVVVVVVLVALAVKGTTITPSPAAASCYLFY